jgi:hypothetical protein
MVQVVPGGAAPANAARRDCLNRARAGRSGSWQRESAGATGRTICWRLRQSCVPAGLAPGLAPGLARGLAPGIDSAADAQTEEVARGGRERAWRAPGERAGGVLAVAGDSDKHCRTDGRPHDNGRHD